MIPLFLPPSPPLALLLVGTRPPLSDVSELFGVDHPDNKAEIQDFEIESPGGAATEDAWERSSFGGSS